MVRIQKGEGENEKVLKVPGAAFENFYKGAGWRMVDSIPKLMSVEAPEEDEWGDYDGSEDGEDEFTKPLSEMTRPELEAYAAKLGIDMTGLNTNKQYREAIKAAM